MKYIAAILLLTSVVCLKATDYNCPDCTQSNVQYYLSHVLNTSGNDRLILPAGSAIWIGGVYGTNQSIIGNCALHSGAASFGAGVSSTFIIEELTNNTAAVPPGPLGFFYMTYTNTSAHCQIEGINFINPYLTNYTHYLINILGNATTQVRVDNCTFSNALSTLAIFQISDVWGVGDHNTFYNVNQAEHAQHFDTTYGATNGNNWGNASWADSDNLGGSNAWFWENNVYTEPTMAGGMDSFEGARWVVRYNIFTNAQLTLHGTEGQGRGAKSLEIYSNTFIHTAGGQIFGQYRSGTGVIFSNAFLSFTAPLMSMEVYRLFNQVVAWGGATGVNPWDSNDPTIYYTGTHNGSNNSSIMQDTTANFPVPNGLAGYVVRNLNFPITWSSNNVTTNGWAEIVSNTKTNLTLSLAWQNGFAGKTNVAFNTGDTYEVRKVIYALDAVGMGKSDLLYGNSSELPPTNHAYFPNESPNTLFAWANTSGGSAVDLLSSSDPIVIMAGVEYSNSVVAKPGYIPYVYPHPLEGGIVTNLTISSSISTSQTGQSVTFSSFVQTNGITAADITGGTVTFRTNTVSCGTGTLLNGGTALAFTFTAAGTYSVTATWPGNTEYPGALTSYSISQVVTNPVTPPSTYFPFAPIMPLH